MQREFDLQQLHALEEAAREQREFDAREARDKQALEDAQLRANLYEQGLQRDLEREKMQHEIAMAQLNNATPRPTPRSGDPNIFKVEAAIKLMPKLINENKIDIYLVTFQKIAELHGWPKQHWPAYVPITDWNITPKNGG